MILWILDFGAARVIKQHLNDEEYEEYCEDNSTAEKLLASVGCDIDSCNFMITEDYVELEIFS